jgi:hypothetical protein
MDRQHFRDESFQTKKNGFLFVAHFTIDPLLAARTERSAGPLWHGFAISASRVTIVTKKDM